MSLERVIEEILQRGERETQEILDSANQERERTLSEVRARGEELLREKEKQGEEQASRERIREMARADLESKRIILHAQKEVLDKVLSQAKEELRSSGSRKDLLEKLVDANRQEIADGVLLCNKTDAPILRKLVDADLRDDISTIGGFIIESKDGSRRVNLTYETFLDDLWEDVVKDVASILWKER